MVFMALDKMAAERLFAAEVGNLCNMLGLAEQPKYSFGFGEYPRSEVKYGLFGSLAVRINATDFREYPTTLEAEAAHLVFGFARKRLGLKFFPAYGEAFDYFNQVRRLYEKREMQKA